MVLSVLISLLLSLGYISSEAEYHAADQVQQEQWEDIIIEDCSEF